MTKVGRPKRGEVRQKEAPSAKHPLIKAFDENRYRIIPWDRGFCLYDKETPCNRANAAFMGKFYINNNGDKYVYNENYYKTIPELINAMEMWLKNQPFDRVVYDPTYRINSRLEFAISDYLYDIGFKREYKLGYRDEDIYTLKDGYGCMLCELMIEVKQDTTEGKVTRTFGGNMWMDSEFKDYDSAFGAINSLLITLMPQQALLTGLYCKMNGHRANEVFTHTFDEKTLTTYTESSREQTIKMLEKELEELKKF